MGLFSGSFWSNLGNSIINSFDPLGLFSGFTGATGNKPMSKATGTGNILSDTWDTLKNGNTNDVNYQVAQDNLGYQRERNAIEDERYAEETAYNRMFQEDERNYQRAFAEEERDYQRALQQKIFEREDTSIQRQVNALSEMGINPLSQNLQGLGAGQALSPSSAGASVGMPSASARGGSALHNDFKAVSPGDMLASLSGLVQAIDGFETSKLTRDSLALENDKKFLSNMALAHDYGINYSGLFSSSKSGWLKNAKNGIKQNFTDDTGKRLFDNDLWNESSKSLLLDKVRKNQNNKHAYYNNIYDTDSPKAIFLKDFASDDYTQLLEKLFTKGANIFDNVANNFLGKKLDFSDLISNFFMKLF